MQKFYKKAVKLYSLNLIVYLYQMNTNRLQKQRINK